MDTGVVVERTYPSSCYRVLLFVARLEITKSVSPVIRRRSLTSEYFEAPFARQIQNNEQSTESIVSIRKGVNGLKEIVDDDDVDKRMILAYDQFPTEHELETSVTVSKFPQQACFISESTSISTTKELL